MFQRFFTALITALGTLALLWGVGWIWFSANVVVMQPQLPETRTDAIIVLTGGNGRVQEGVALLDKKMAQKLFISGVNEKVKIEDLVQGRPIPCCITLGYSATNTEGNAMESAQWIAQNKVKSIRLVTSNYHMVRARLIFGSIAENLDVIPHPVAPDNFDPWGGQFWPTTFGEYNKSIATWIKQSVKRERV